MEPLPDEYGEVEARVDGFPLEMGVVEIFPEESELDGGADDF